MKIKHFFTAILLFSLLITKAQMSDLAKMMGDKELVSWNNIYNYDHSLYGTIFFYKGDKIDKKHHRYEYLVFDKNLNLIAKNGFSQRNIFLHQNFFYTSTNVDNQLFLTVEYRTKDKEKRLFCRTFRKIDLNKNTVSKDFYFDGEKIKTAVQDIKNLSFISHFRNQFIPVKTGTNSGFLIVEYPSLRRKNYQINRLRFYNNDNQVQWAFHYNENAKKGTYEYIDYIYIKDNLALIEFHEFVKKRFSGIRLVGLDLTNGQKKFEYQVENKDSEKTHYIGYYRKYDDKIYLTGRFFPSYKSTFGYALGLFRIVLDTSGKEISKKYIFWEEFGKYLKINKKAKVGNGYQLKERDYFIFKDGSVSYLSEKYKHEKEIMDIYIAPKTTDMVLMNMDADFNVKDAITIQKVKSKYSYDYLFSQYVKDNTGCVFFFQDYKKDKIKKDKIGVLGINKYINSEYSFEEIPIYSKKEEYTIYPIPAKEGYIILREFNKDEKYDQIRLEKINY